VAAKKILGCPSWAPEEEGLKLEALHIILYMFIEKANLSQEFIWPSFSYRDFLFSYLP